MTGFLATRLESYRVEVEVGLITNLMGTGRFPAIFTMGIKSAILYTESSLNSGIAISVLCEQTTFQKGGKIFVSSLPCRCIHSLEM